jgi:hypothetical protein
LRHRETDGSPLCLKAARMGSQGHVWQCISDPEVVAGPGTPFMRIRISSRIVSFAS